MKRSEQNKKKDPIMWCYKVLFDEWLSMKIGLLPQNNDTIVKNNDNNKTPRPSNYDR